MVRCALVNEDDLQLWCIYSIYFRILGRGTFNSIPTAFLRLRDLVIFTGKGGIWVDVVGMSLVQIF